MPDPFNNSRLDAVYEMLDELEQTILDAVEELDRKTFVEDAPMLVFDIKAVQRTKTLFHTLIDARFEGESDSSS